MLEKTEYRAPFSGVITNLPVREGETVVIGIQNSPGSTLMTLADGSVITAEVKVDETDIVNVKLGQPAEVTIDALPRKKFKGVVTEIGENAILRTSGLSTAQSTTGSQEARDFKVTVTWKIRLKIFARACRRRPRSPRRSADSAMTFPSRRSPSGSVATLNPGEAASHL